MPFHFDWTITLGTIVQLVIVLVALARMLNKLFKRLEVRMISMEDRVDMLWAWLMVQMTPEQRKDYGEFYQQWHDRLKRKSETLGLTNN